MKKGYVIALDRNDNKYFSKIYIRDNYPFLGEFPLEKAKVYKTRRGVNNAIEKINREFEYHFCQEDIFEVYITENGIPFFPEEMKK